MLCFSLKALMFSVWLFMFIVCIHVVNELLSEAFGPLADEHFEHLVIQCSQAPG